MRHNRRDVWTGEEVTFLATVRATIHDRDVELPSGAIFHRPQRGVDWHPFTDGEGNEIDDEPRVTAASA